MTAVAHETQIPTGTWQIDPGHSLVEFSITYLGIGKVKGRFGGFSGSLVNDEGGIRLEGEIDIASVTTHQEERDAHLASPDFFDVSRHPKAHFRSSAVSLDEDGAVELRGLLTLKGVEREIVLAGTVRGPAGDPWGNDRIALDLAGSLDRDDFGIGWNAPLPGGGSLLGNSVKLELVFSAVRRA
ncbi:MAG: YceI family protein [Gaiellaceae bacterium]